MGLMKVIRVLMAVSMMMAAGTGTGAGDQQAAKRPTPKDPFAGQYDIKGLGLGTELTIVVAFAADKCPACGAAMPFYRKLMGLPRMDGKARRFIIVATDGVWPVKDVLDTGRLEPHRLTSGPYPARALPGVTVTPTLLLLDAAGRTVGKWEGPLSSDQQNQVLAAVEKMAPSKGKQP